MSEREPLHTGTDDLLGWVTDGVAVLSFNRPSARNALSQPMYGGIATALPEIASRADIGCLVLTGEGGAFCAGWDLKSATALADQEDPLAEFDFAPDHKPGTQRSARQRSAGPWHCVLARDYG